MSRANKGSCFEWTKRSKNNLTSQTRITLYLFRNDIQYSHKNVYEFCMHSNECRESLYDFMLRTCDERMHAHDVLHIYYDSEEALQPFVCANESCCSCLFFFVQSSIQFYCACLVIFWSCEHEDGCYWQAAQLTNSTVSQNNAHKLNAKKRRFDAKWHTFCVYAAPDNSFGRSESRWICNRLT